MVAAAVLKEKPPISAGGDIMAVSAPLLAAPNTKPAGSFSSGLPKLNAGVGAAAAAATSFSVEMVAPKLGVGEEEEEEAFVSGPPSLPNTEPAGFSEVVWADGAPPLTFSEEDAEGRVKVREGADAVPAAVVVVVSLGFESPKEKPTASAPAAPAPPAPVPPPPPPPPFATRAS